MHIRKVLTFLAAASMLVAVPFVRRGQARRWQGQRRRRDDVPAAGVERRGLEILSNYYPGYWWDHTDLTIAAQFHPSATTEQQAAIQDAIATWSATLLDCFDGLITLTDVTGQQRTGGRHRRALRAQPPAVSVFGGYAICGDHGCPNILVRSDLHQASIANRTTLSISAG